MLGGLAHGDLQIQGTGYAQRLDHLELQYRFRGIRERRMAIKLVGRVHHIDAVACSGGVDSMAALTFLTNKPKTDSTKVISAVFFNHGTETSKKALVFVKAYCSSHYIKLNIGNIVGYKPSSNSWESWWRQQRYDYLHSLDMVIATAHHLDDVAETYLWGCINGQPRFIHYNKPYNGAGSNIVRPFLLTPKSELIDYCKRKSSWINDESNKDVAFSRNRIRHNIIPEVKQVNPGFLRVVERLLRKDLVAKNPNIKLPT